MLLHDRVTVWVEEVTGLDSHNNPIVAWVNKGIVAAEVTPSSSDVDTGTGQVVSRYRIALATTVPIASNIRDALRIDWHDVEGLRVDGAVERHYMRGRLHHYEMLTKSVI